MCQSVDIVLDARGEFDPQNLSWTAFARQQPTGAPDQVAQRQQQGTGQKQGEYDTAKTVLPISIRAVTIADQGGEESRHGKEQRQTEAVDPPDEPIEHWVHSRVMKRPK